MPILGWIPGMSAEDAAQREINAGQLKDDGTGIKEGKYNWQDRFGGFLGGYDQSDVEAAGQLIRDTALQKKIDQKYGTIGDELGGLGLKTNYKGSVTGISETELMKQIAGDTSKLKAALNYLGIDNADAGDLNPNATATGIVQAGTKLKASNKTAEETKVQNEIERKEGRTDKLLLMQMNNAAEDRRVERELRRDQQAYQNRVLDLKEARMDRRDRQAAIQQMMAGLAQLGASIAI
jgi:hypothetical protein